MGEEFEDRYQSELRPLTREKDDYDRREPQDEEDTISEQGSVGDFPFGRGVMIE